MSRLNRAWSAFLTVGGRVGVEDRDYIRVALINVLGAVAGLIWAVFLLHNTWLLFSGARVWGRVLVDGIGTLVCVGVLVALRIGTRVELISRVANAGTVVLVLGLVAFRDAAGTSLMMVAIYPFLAFFLLDDVRRACVWTMLVTVLVCGFLLAGMGPWEPKAWVLAEVIPTVIVVMLTEAVAMAVLVSGRKRVLLRLNETREKLTDESLHDALTGLYNRRSFDEFFDRYLARVRRGRSGLAMLMVDIDHFKEFNDTYGHPAGDEALQAVAKAITGTFARGEDIVFRLGGEELGVIYFAESLERAEALAASAERAVSGLGLSSPGGPGASLTISGGLVWVPPGTYTDSVTVYREADRALYRAKAEGRARFETADIAVEATAR